MRTDVLNRLYGMGFNLIPVNGKHPPCIEWTQYQNQRVTPEEMKEWLKGKFPNKSKTRLWRAENLNFAVLTGATPWTDNIPGIIVIDMDDEEAQDLVRKTFPDTPVKQRTGSGGIHWVYRRPSVEEVPYIPNRQKTWFGGKQFNLDVRGDGGYVMCPGSVHPTTKQLYLEDAPWTKELLEQCPVYDPSWLVCEHSAKTKARSRPQRGQRREIDAPDHDLEIGEIDIPLAERERQAGIYLEAVPGTQKGTGADRSCTALTMKLLKGFALPSDVVLEMLSEWGQKEDQLDDGGGWYPWTEEEIERKIDWCLGQEYSGEIGDRLHAVCELGDMEAKIDEIVTPFELDDQGSADETVIDSKDQLGIAQSFYSSNFSADGLGTLVHHQGCWHRWTGKRYEVVPDDDIKARLWLWLADCKSRTKKGKLAPFQPSRNVVNGVLDALKAVANTPSNFEAPCWLSDGFPAAGDIIAFENGLLDVGTFLSSGDADLFPHSPQWFSGNCLPHPFDPEAKCPQWLEFLEQVFDEDQERINALQQWFGYNLVADNRQHKMLLMIGPPRSGKGTTMAVMSAMLGNHNVASTSLASLGGRFGLEPLVGKMAALIDEGHLGRFSDTSAVLERLKAISGGSEQTIDRKGLAAVPSVSLKVRFTIAVNELPRLSDASAALRSRLLVLPFFNSYEGKEDFGLVDRLLSEVSGITNWAMAGLRELKQAGRFKMPTAGEKILRDFVYLSSPVQAFLDDCCVVGVNNEISLNDLQLAWRLWCDENGHVPGSIADFSKKLRAVVPRIDDERRRVNGGRERWYIGVALTSEARIDIARARNGIRLE